MKYALLILCMQNYYYDNVKVKPSIKISMNSACGYINMALDLFRKKDLPIIWIQVDGEEDMEGPFIDFITYDIHYETRDFEIIDKLKQNKLEKIITKKIGRSGFKETGLLEYIKENKIDTLIITGFSAQYDVLYTYEDAEDYDLKPIILKNGIAETFDGEIERIEKKISNIITIYELEKIIE